MSGVLRALGIALKAGLFLSLVVGAPIAGIFLSRQNDVEVGRVVPPAKRAEKPRATDEPRVPNDFVAVLLPPQMANLSPRTDGKVLAVRVKVGQAVRTNDVLMAFDPREKQHDLAIAQAQLRESRAEAYGAGSDLAAARKRASRRNATVEVGGRRIALVSGEEAAQAHFEAQGAAARSASAAAKIAEQKARVDQLRLSLEETTIRAPFDGVVTALYFEPGTTARTGDVVARVVGGVGLRTRIAVPEEAAELVLRKRARLVLEGRTLFANIDQVAREVEPASRAFLVEGSVELGASSCAGDCAMLAGRSVRASLLREGER